MTYVNSDLVITNNDLAPTTTDIIPSITEPTFPPVDEVSNNDLTPETEEKAIDDQYQELYNNIIETEKEKAIKYQELRTKHSVFFDLIEKNYSIDDLIIKDKHKARLMKVTKTLENKKLSRTDKNATTDVIKYLKKSVFPKLKIAIKDKKVLNGITRLEYKICNRPYEQIEKDKDALFLIYNIEHILNILLSTWKNSSLEEISFENIEESSLITEIFKSINLSEHNLTEKDFITFLYNDYLKFDDETMIKHSSTLLNRISDLIILVVSLLLKHEENLDKVLSPELKDLMNTIKNDYISKKCFVDVNQISLEFIDKLIIYVSSVKVHLLTLTKEETDTIDGEVLQMIFSDTTLEQLDLAKKTIIDFMYGVVSNIKSLLDIEKKPNENEMYINLFCKWFEILNTKMKLTPEYSLYIIYLIMKLIPAPFLKGYHYMFSLMLQDISAKFIKF